MDINRRGYREKREVGKMSVLHQEFNTRNNQNISSENTQKHPTTHEDNKKHSKITADEEERKTQVPKEEPKCTNQPKNTHVEMSGG